MEPMIPALPLPLVPPPADPRYSVDWLPHSDNLTAHLRHFLDKRLFADLVLDCRGATFHVHKVVVAASSEFLAKRPTALYLKMDLIRPEVMRCLVEFMYFGRVLVPPADMEEFVSAGSKLRIRGLTFEVDDVSGITAAVKSDAAVLAASNAAVDGSGFQEEERDDETEKKNDGSVHQATFSVHAGSNEEGERGNISNDGVGQGASSSSANDEGKSAKTAEITPASIEEASDGDGGSNAKEDDGAVEMSEKGEDDKGEAAANDEARPMEIVGEEESVGDEAGKKTANAGKNGDMLFNPRVVLRREPSVESAAEKLSAADQDRDGGAAARSASNAALAGWDFGCNLCEKTYRSKYGLDRHLRQLHEGSFSCNMCGKLFGSKASLTQHMTAHPRKAGRPAVASSPSGGKKCSMTSIKESVTMKQGKESFACSRCKRVFGSKLTLRGHSPKCHILKPLPCVDDRQMKLVSRMLQKTTKGDVVVCKDRSFHSKRLLDAPKCEDCGSAIGGIGGKAAVFEHKSLFCKVCAKCGRRFKSASQCQMHGVGCDRK